MYVKICKKCGLIRLNPHWDKESYTNFYKNEYDKSREIIYDEDRLVEMFMLFEKANIKIFPKKILDIGAGDGIDLKRMREQLWLNNTEFYAIEPSEYCIKKLKKSKIKVISKVAEDNWDKKYTCFFDFI